MVRPGNRSEIVAAAATAIDLYSLSFVLDAGAPADASVADPVPAVPDAHPQAARAIMTIASRPTGSRRVMITACPTTSVSRSDIARATPSTAVARRAAEPDQQDCG